MICEDIFLSFFWILFRWNYTNWNSGRYKL